MMSRLEAVTSLCAIFVAAIALAVAIYEAKVIRDHQELSVWPYLTFYSTSVAKLNDKPMPLAFYLKNDGIGPAKVKTVKYKFNGKEYKKNMKKIFNQILPKNKSGSLTTDTEVMSVMLPQKEHLLLGAYTSDKETQLFFKKAQEGQLEFEVCYCSLYEQCWLLHGKNEHKEVGECKPQ